MNTRLQMNGTTLENDKTDFNGVKLSQPWTDQIDGWVDESEVDNE